MSDVSQDQDPATEGSDFPLGGLPEGTPDVDHNEQSEGDQSEPADAPVADPSQDIPGTGS